MKAYKGCVNRECKSFKHKKHYRDEFEYCPICGEKLEYVCADCWKVMEHSTERYCASCKAKHEQNRDRKIQQGKEMLKIIPVVPAAKLIVKNKGVILKKANDFKGVVINIVKK